MVAIASALGALRSFASTHSSDLLGAAGGIGSFLGNQVGSAIASHRAWKYAVKQNTLQYLTDKRQKSEYYEIMRNSLARGGYNPLLALGSSVSGNSSGGSFPLSDSDQGDQAINSAMAMKNFEYQNKLLKEQVKGQEKDNETKDLTNEKLKFENRTDPKKILTDFIDNGKSEDVSKLVKNVKEKTNEFLGKLPTVPSQSSGVSATSVVSNKHKAVKLVHDASKGSKKANLVLNTVVSNPVTRAALVGYLGYKTVKHIINVYRNRNKKDTGHSNGYDFEYIKDKDLY